MITIETTFLAEVKKHLRISHTSDDDLIKNEIHVSINNIYTQLLIKQETEIPASTNDLSENVKLAVKHMVAKFRTNPDGSVQTKLSIVDKQLILKILGKELSYGSF